MVVLVDRLGQDLDILFHEYVGARVRIRELQRRGEIGSVLTGHLYPSSNSNNTQVRQHILPSQTSAGGLVDAEAHVVANDSLGYSCDVHRLTERRLIRSLHHGQPVRAILKNNDLALPIRVGGPLPETNTKLYTAGVNC